MVLCAEEAAGSGAFHKRGVSAKCLEGVCVSPALEKVFDEIWSNALDRIIRDPSVTKLSVAIDGGSITVKNDGLSIPVKMMPVPGGGEDWTPAVVMSRLMSGSNSTPALPTIATAAAARSAGVAKPAMAD